MNNALHEGGPRNGVMTAVEDFVAEYDRELRLLVVPIYFGLAIVVEEERIASVPSSARRSTASRPGQFLRELLELSERLRIKEMHWGQVVFYTWQDRLDALGRALPGAAADEPRRRAARRSTTLLACLDTIRERKGRGRLRHTAGSPAATPRC